MTSAGHQLRSLAHKHLKEAEYASLKKAIKTFRQTHSVLTLCETLRSLLTTWEKRQLLVHIYTIIPSDYREDFDRLCLLQFEGYESLIRPRIQDAYGLTKSGQEGSGGVVLGGGRPRRQSSRTTVPVEQLRTIMNLESRGKATSAANRKEGLKVGSPARRADIIRVRRDSSRSSEGRKEHKRSKTAEGEGSNIQQAHVPPLHLTTGSTQTRGCTTTSHANPSSRANPTSSAAPVCIRKIKLEHRQNESLGFSIRGGKDLHAGIYVSEVDEDSQAMRHGLKVGERILKVNDLPFKNITHAQAVVALKSSRQLILYVAPVGIMPGSTPNGTPRSDSDSARSTGSQPKNLSTRHEPDGHRGSSCHGNSQDDGGASSSSKRVTIVAEEEDGWLGCSIRGGVDFSLAVTVTNVDPMSPAWVAGLKKGTQITKVNGVSVGSLKHADIISLVTASNVVVLDVTSAPPINKLARKHRRSNTADNESSRKAGTKPPSQVIPTQSPIRCGRMVQDATQFELELQSTPPVSTSTPLPPDDHPALLSNRVHDQGRDQGTSSPADPRYVTILHDSGELEDTATENVSCGGGGRGRRSKFDKDTIRLNMADVINTDNILGDTANRTPTKKDHVKDIFHLNANVEEYQTPVSSPKPDRNSVAGLNTPERNRYINQCMNMLSSPYNNIEQELRLANYRPATPSRQLPIMRPLVASQLSHELTGRHTKPPLCPNIPATTTTSPVAKLFKRVMRRRRSSGGSPGHGGTREGLRRQGSNSSLDSLNCGGGDRKSLSSCGTSPLGGGMHTSAYDLITDSEGDVTLL